MNYSDYQPSLTISPDLVKSLNLIPSAHYHVNSSLVVHTSDGREIDVIAEFDRMQKRIEWLEETLRTRYPHELDDAS